MVGLSLLSLLGAFRQSAEKSVEQNGTDAGTADRNRVAASESSGSTENPQPKRARARVTRHKGHQKLSTTEDDAVDVPVETVERTADEV